MNIDIAGFTKQEVLELIYAGLEVKKGAIQAKIAEIHSQLGSRDGHPPQIALKTLNGPKKRVLSPEARRSIALAQKKRWSAYHRAQNQPAKRKSAAATRKPAKSAKSLSRKRVPPPEATNGAESVQ